MWNAFLLVYSVLTFDEEKKNRKQHMVFELKQYHWQEFALLFGQFIS